MTSRVCIIVDNPLRDLDGLVLVAWQLVQQGIEAVLVPMYTQAFDVPALNPDMVVANYVRPNNADLLKTYKEAGILVGVLDTEGAAGKTADDYARMVSRMQCGDYVDLYCLWGRSQYEAFHRHRTVPPAVLRLTGCPRYDFCAMPWRAALPVPPGVRDYVLINTNFPVANPRFSKNASRERRAMVQAGFDERFAREFAADAKRAHQTIIEVIGRLASSFTDLTFVLRPHPFEDAHAYNELLQLPNCQVRQEGTSLEWLNSASVLLHQNCSTALEAVMLGKEPISLEWFNTPALMLPAASAVSIPACNYEALVTLLEGVRARQQPVLDDAHLEARQKIICELYFSIDGQSAARVAAAVADIIRTKRERIATVCSARRYEKSLRLSALARARRFLGYRAYNAIRKRISNKTIERRRSEKFFTVDDVNAVLARINKVMGAPTLVGKKVANDPPRHRLASGHAIQISKEFDTRSSIASDDKLTSVVVV